MQFSRVIMASNASMSGRPVPSTCFTWMGYRSSRREGSNAEIDDATRRPQVRASSRRLLQFGEVLGEVWHMFARHVWMLLAPTITIMLLTSVVTGALLVFVPWASMLASTAPLMMLLVAVLATFMPAPIALDVMFAALLLRQGVASGYVMLFAMTLGVYSIVPAVYLWREVSKPLSVILFVFFAFVGWLCGLIF